MERGLHVGIIPDGSRRWAKRNKVAKGDWARSGKTTDDIVTHVFTKHPGVTELSLWAMSTENVDRDDYSRNLVYSMLKGKLEDLLESGLTMDAGVRVNVVGSRLRDVPEDIKGLAEEITSKTRDNSSRTLNICIGYGGKQEILDASMAASRWLRKNPAIAKLHSSIFEKYLMVPKPLDLVIRTGGERRLSGFMLYQIEYAELFFVDKLWPDFTAADFDAIMEKFRSRERRYGR